MDKCFTNYEVIIINDGSTDNTENILNDLCKSNKNTSYFNLKKEQGQSRALAKGLELSRYELIVTVDADMQHNPGYIEEFLEKIYEGYDAVIGWRKVRAGGQYHRKICSYLGNKIMNFVCGTDFKDMGSSFRVFKKSLLEDEDIHNGYHRFLPVIFSKKSASIFEYPIRLEKRRFGSSRYNLFKLFNCASSVLYLLFFDKKYGVLRGTG